MATTLAPTREGMRDTGIPTQFKNEPSTDFTNPENARRMKAAIERVRSELGREYDLVIGGRHLKTAEKTNSLNPPSRRRLSASIRPQAQPKSSPRCRRR